MPQAAPQLQLRPHAARHSQLAALPAPGCGRRAARPPALQCSQPAALPAPGCGRRAARPPALQCSQLAALAAPERPQCSRASAPTALQAACLFASAALQVACLSAATALQTAPQAAHPPAAASYVTAASRCRPAKAQTEGRTTNAHPTVAAPKLCWEGRSRLQQQGGRGGGSTCCRRPVRCASRCCHRGCHRRYRRTRHGQSRVAGGARQPPTASLPPPPLLVCGRQDRHRCRRAKVCPPKSAPTSRRRARHRCWPLHATPCRHTPTPGPAAYLHLPAAYRRLPAAHHDLSVADRDLPVAYRRCTAAGRPVAGPSTIDPLGGAQSRRHPPPDGMATGPGLHSPRLPHRARHVLTGGMQASRRRRTQYTRRQRTRTQWLLQRSARRHGPGPGSRRPLRHARRAPSGGALRHSQTCDLMSAARLRHGLRQYSPRWYIPRPRRAPSDGTPRQGQTRALTPGPTRRPPRTSASAAAAHGRRATAKAARTARCRRRSRRSAASAAAAAAARESGELRESLGEAT
eukprot:364736-Chlamydomonas_euryale.AAC.1